MNDSKALEVKSGPVESEPNPPQSEEKEANSFNVEPNSSGESTIDPAPSSKSRGRPFAPGNSGNPNGRPRGVSNRVQLRPPFRFQ
jgi:hypothetical protein